MKTILLSFLLFPFLCFSQRIISLDSMGAKGDMSSNDATIINTAFNAGGGTTPIIVQGSPGKTYGMSAALIYQSNLTFDGRGAHVYSLPSLAQQWSYNRINGTTAFSQSVSISCTEGATTFTYSSAGSLKIGQVVYLRGDLRDTVDNNGTYWGWFGKVVSISGTTVTLSEACDGTFTANNITVYNPKKNVTIKNVTFDFYNRTQGVCLDINNATDITLQNVIINGKKTWDGTSLEVGIQMERVCGFLVDSTKIMGGRYNGHCCWYAINPDGYGTLSNSFFSGYTEGINLGGTGNPRVEVKNCEVTDCSMIGGTHESGRFYWHDSYMHIVDSSNVSAYMFSIRYSNNRFENNRIEIQQLDNTVSKSVFYMYGMTEKNLIFNNNNISQTGGAPGWAFRFISPYQTVQPLNPYSGMKIEGNTLNQPIFMGWKWGANNTIKNNYFDAPTNLNSYIIMQPLTTGWGLDVDSNTFVNRTLSTNNYYLKTTTTAAQLRIRGNKSYLTNCSNTSTTAASQLSLSSQTNVTQSGNSVLTCTTPPPNAPTMQIVNRAPVVDASIYGNISIVLPDTTAMLHASAYDPDGDPITLQWSMISGNTCFINPIDTLNTSITFYQAGQYIFLLTATDDHGNTTSDTVTVTVHDNTAPTGGKLKGRGKVKFAQPLN